MARASNIALRLSLSLVALWLTPAWAESGMNKSFIGKYKTTAHSCTVEHCEDQAETLTSSFYIGRRNVHVYSGANKGLVLRFGNQHVSTEGMSVWIVPTPAGFDETYAKDGFMVAHHYAIRADGTCSVSVSVLKTPAKISTTYSTEMDSCRVSDGNIFAAQ